MNIVPIHCKLDLLPLTNYYYTIIGNIIIINIFKLLYEN